MLRGQVESDTENENAEREDVRTVASFSRTYRREAAWSSAIYDLYVLCPSVLDKCTSISGRCGFQTGMRIAFGFRTSFSEPHRFPNFVFRTS
eukprot:9129648-Pyramimonas_sp.AAC.1